LVSPLFAQSNVTIETSDKQALRVKARNAFIRAKELGVQEPVVEALIQRLRRTAQTQARFRKTCWQTR